eukprot:TRINITY_DN12209_c0_g2_i3.p2 TRINITY_DN12209_c0_g2~~TRINITY_DN12209_c0_g2_i3.p2  ORF type:complete len:101 (+),score=33.75 TRINITY_DN12209_c0_g2_i3:506-808(+)
MSHVASLDQGSMPQGLSALIAAAGAMIKEGPGASHSAAAVTEAKQGSTNKEPDCGFIKAGPTTVFETEDQKLMALLSSASAMLGASNNQGDSSNSGAGSN